jgi:hypothetical protein
VFSTIKNYLLAGLAVISGILAALWQYQRAKFKSAQLDGSEKARKTERKATDAMTKGLKDEAKPVNHSDKRDDFK